MAKGTLKSKGERAPAAHGLCILRFLVQAVPRTLRPLPKEERHGRFLEDPFRIKCAEDSAPRKRTQTERSKGAEEASADTRKACHIHVCLVQGSPSRSPISRVTRPGSGLRAQGVRCWRCFYFEGSRWPLYPAHGLPPVAPFQDAATPLAFSSQPSEPERYHCFILGKKEDAQLQPWPRFHASDRPVLGFLSRAPCAGV